MPRNGSGTYTLPAGNPVVTGTTISSTWANTTLSDIATALTQSLSKDGQTTPTADLPMGGFSLTGLAAGAALGESLRFQQLFDQGIETDIASAGTTDIGAVNSNFLRVTGTTTITSFGTNYVGPRFIRFAGALTLTHNASTLILPTGANITTAAGDTCVLAPIATSLTPSGWQVLVYQRASGVPLVADVDYLNTVRIDVASATTVDLNSDAPNTRHINITGTTTITGFTITSGNCYFVRFNAALTLTDNSAIVTNRGANITTASGDTCIIRATATDTVEVLCYLNAATTSQAGISELATSAEAIAGTDATRTITPATLFGGLNASGSAPIYAARAWVNFNGTGTVAIRASGNVSSITDNGTGDYTVNFSTALPSNYCPAGNATRATLSSTNDAICFANTTPTTSAYRFSTTTGSGTLVDSLYTTITFFG